MLQSLAVLFLLAATHPQDAGAPPDLRTLAAKAARASKILMVRFEPAGVPDAANLDQVIAGDAELKAAFAKRFEVESRVLTDPVSQELNRKLGTPARGTWPGVALVDPAGELLTVVDADAWKSDGKWDVVRLRRFVEFWTPPADAKPGFRFSVYSGDPPKSNRLQECKAKYGDIYNPKADARADIAAAVAKAKAEGKHALVKVGGNWCPWCYFLHDELETRPKLKEMVEHSYVLVRVSVDKDNPNTEALAELGNPQRFGYPVLVVLDGEGKRLHTQDSGLLEVGDHHDPKQVEQFLRGWTPEALAPKPKR